jgi:hypothetical protein
MEVKDIIIYSLRLIGRVDIADLLENGGELTDENQEVVTTLVYCFNAVEDEVARSYIPLKIVESVQVVSGSAYYSLFKRTPVKIKRVSVNGKEVDYKLFPLYMTVNESEVEVEYEYSPSKKSLNGVSDFSDGTLGAYAFACGTASEYCFINGEADAGEIWEKKYREEIDTAQQKLIPRGNIPLRRWV